MTDVATQAPTREPVVAVDYGISRVSAAKAHSSDTDDGAVTNSSPDLPLRCIITRSIMYRYLLPPVKTRRHQ
ncbi:hypothetical protein QBC32DRAFT_326705 [Pseudoneurospora amorphoporcata]|uniref:Uncharacterized protein n=1 Tax=Pseudoneurospora amorphoporcata TaxID=241081 RepID=A0AAN6NPQ5_9PEZI|nr:hypothetical protein QBC32DRAFT_326705 [Pseudoneurospora amorphoporcata]